MQLLLMTVNPHQKLVSKTRSMSIMVLYLT